MDIPLSNTQINKAVGPDSYDILLYKDLHKYDSIDELFYDDDLRIILIESKAGVGHWVSLIKDGDTFIYFDSYGKSPDYWVRFLKPFYRTLLGDSPAEIKRLARGKKLIYNKMKLQGKDSSICGRWQILFYDMHKMGYSLPEFQKFMKLHKKTSYDALCLSLVPI
jgi:hypothetical protein